MRHPVQVGKRTRWSFARIKEVLEMPNLIEIQQNSYQWFLKEGLKEMFRDISPIQDFTGNLVLEFIDYSLGEPKYSVEECKERDVTFAAPLRALRVSSTVSRTTVSCDLIAPREERARATDAILTLSGASQSV